MSSMKLCLVICALLGVYGVECCDPFKKDAKVTIYTGSPLDPQELILKNGLQEAKDAYRIEIYDQDIPELCEGAIKGFKDLDTLVIKNSGITKLVAGAFQDVPHLRILDLSHNTIKSVPSGVFNELGIRRLNLSSNSIAKVDSDAFNAMPQLQVIELESNYIKKIDNKWFTGSPKVYRVELGYNGITEIPKDAFKNLAESKQRDRPIDIWMTNNLISEVHPLAFRNMQDVETLWLSYNNIAELKDITFENVGKIHNLQIDNNKLRCLSDGLLGGMKVDELNVDGNPLDCDCLRKIRKWGQKKNVETQSARRGFACLRDQIDNVITSQKKYYEEKIKEEKF